jgi:phosphoenolpyruvate synthase/pyruvate phosphate dikinase
VCAGVVQARACVITDLAEIDQLKDGDVLITYCTDIGWSPYFPMLGGIATELGGLVSHGNLQFMVHPIQKISFF